MKFPVPRSVAVEMFDDKETLDDQSGVLVLVLVLFSPARITRFPSPEMERRPERSVTGVSRLATHKTVSVEKLKYHIPT